MNLPATTTQLLTLDPRTFVAATYEPFEAALAAAINTVPSVPHDVTTKTGMTLAKEGRARFREIRIGLEKKRAAAKAPILEIGKLLDVRAKEISVKVEPYEEMFDQPIKAEEARIEADKEAMAKAEGERQAKIQAALDEIRKAPVTATTASTHDIASLLAGLVMIRDNLPTADDATYQERTAEALYMLGQTIPQMESILAGKNAQEELAAQLEAQRIEQARIAAEQEFERKAAQKREHEAILSESARQKAERKEIERQKAELAEAQRTMEDKQAGQERQARVAERKIEEEAQRLAEESNAAGQQEQVASAQTNIHVGADSPVSRLALNEVLNFISASKPSDLLQIMDALTERISDYTGSATGTEDDRHAVLMQIQANEAEVRLLRER